jgi:hypothetical protein
VNTEESETSSSDSSSNVDWDDMFNSNDKLVKGGDLFKFKPGLSNNFIQRYVELSTNAFRYFENYYKSLKGVPIVCFRKKIIMKCIPYKVNKTSYLKPGSKVFK